MKKRVLSILALLCAVVFLFTACSRHGKTLIKAGDEKISINVFQLYLSRMRGSLASAGDNVDSASYWKSIVDLENTTQAEFYTNRVLEGLKQIAAALVIYDELGLQLDKETEDSIDEWLEALVESVANGSKTEMNSILSAFGANLTVLRDATIIEAKIDQLKTHLYGSKCELVLDSAKDTFFRDSYFRGKQIWLSNEYHDHEKDADGRTVYYLLNSKGNLTTSVAYDTENGTPVEENGVTVYREYGDIAYDTKNGVATGKRDADRNLIYYVKDADGKATEAIAYDTEKGKPVEEDGVTVYRKWVIAYDEDSKKSSPKYYYTTDKDGKTVAKTAEYTDDEMAKSLLLAKDIVEQCKNNEERFDEAARMYSNSTGFDELAPNGMFFAFGVTYGDTLFRAFSTELQTLEVGELSVIDTNGGGYYILMRCELEEGYYPWADDDNKTWFDGTRGVTFNSMLSEYLLQKKTADYMDRIEIDEELLATVDITMVGTNKIY